MLKGMELVGEQEQGLVLVQHHWFHHMEGYLQWKVVAPDYNNPFKQSVPDHILLDLIKHRAALRRVCGLRLLCEGFELMSFDNLEAPTIATDHPCILALGVNKILDYINTSDAQKFIEEQLERIALSISELLSERAQSEDSLEVVEGSKLTIAQLRKLRETRKAVNQSLHQGQKVRYIYSGGAGPFAAYGR